MVWAAQQTHDPAGRLTAIRPDGGAALTGFSYNAAAGLLAQRQAGGASQSYGYDGVSRLTGLTIAVPGASQAWGFQYNGAGQIITRTSSLGVFESNTAYDVNRSYTANGLNQYTQAGPATFAYDMNGNLSSDGSTTFAYDGENRLVAATGAHNVQLQYDPLGRLARTTGAAATTQFLYDGDELVAEYDGTGVLLRRYVHGTGTDDPVASFDGTDLTRPRHLFSDHQGSIMAITDGAGTVLALNAYDAWGIPNANNAGTFGYTGQAWIPELGMWHYKARVYSPTLGRFLQTDPVGYDDQMNLYAYVGNDPVNGYDPTGMCDPRTDSECINDEESSDEAPPLPTTESTPAQDEITVTGLRERSEQIDERGVSNDDELPIVVTAEGWRPLRRGVDYTVSRSSCTSGMNSITTTTTTIARSAYNGAETGGHLHRLGRAPGPGPDDGHSVATRHVAQYMAWGRGRSFGAGKVEFRSGAGFTYRPLTSENQPPAEDVRARLRGMNRGGGRGTRARRGRLCSSR